MNSDSKKWPQFLVVISASIVVFTAGLHTGWPAPSLPKLLSNEYPFDITNEEASYIVIIGSLGNFFGSFVGNVFMDKIGRRKTLLLIALPQLVSFLCIGFSYHLVELLYLGRFMGGVGEGMTATVILFYIGEIAEHAVRGSMATLVLVAWYSGVLIVNIVGSYLSIRDTALMLAAFPLLFVVLFYKMPESPFYLLMKDEDKKAERALKFLRRTSTVLEELVHVKVDAGHYMCEGTTVRRIFTSNRRAFFTIVGLRFFQLATGVASFNLYFQLLLKQATRIVDPDVGATIVLFTQLVVTVCSSFVIDKWGRKPLLLVSTIGCFLNLTIQSVFFILKERTTVDVSAVDWFPLVMMFLHIFLYSLGLGVVVSVLTSEMFPAIVKPKLICLVNAFYALVTLVCTKYYQFTADEFGLVVPFLTFAVLTMVGILFIWFVVPETKGSSWEEIQEMLMANIVF